MIVNNNIISYNEYRKDHESKEITILFNERTGIIGTIV